MKKGKIITIIGNPGVGKTFLAEKLCLELHDYKYIPEIPSGGIPHYIENSLANRVNLFETILWFRNLQISNYKAAREFSRLGENVLMDTTFYQNQLFVEHYLNSQFEKKILADLGRDDLERFTMPDLTIFIRCEVDEVVRNLMSRVKNRIWETTEWRRYISEMVDSSNSFILNEILSKCKHLVIDRGDFNFEKKSDIDILLKELTRN